MDLPVAIKVFLLAASPILECRGAIPYGFYAGLSPLEVYVLSLLGNLMPVLPLFLGLRAFERRFRHFLVVRYLDSVRRRVAPYVEKYGVMGLALFVAIPLPFTGAWTGTIAAYVLGIDVKKMCLSVVVGVICAALIVELACLGVLQIIWEIP